MILEKAKRLILSFEGLNQPSKWPGGASGITLGYGVDLGYISENEFREDWDPYLSEEAINRLCEAIGKKGVDAKNIASEFSDIVIKRADAEEVFYKSSLPKYEGMTRNTFPGLHDLPLDSQGALVSLVFNRGPSMGPEEKPRWETWDSRREMREIRALITTYNEMNAKDVLQKIADQIRSMKRLWIGKSLDGLLRRRDQEAEMVENCIKGGNNA